MEGKIFGIPLVFVAAGVFVLVLIGASLNTVLKRIDRVVTPVCPAKVLCTCPVCNVATSSAVIATTISTPSAKKVIKFVTPVPTTEGTGI
jgi:hypothetical protein